MFNALSLRYRYTQFFVLLMLCSLIYVMVGSIGSGTTNFQDNFYKKDFLIEKAVQLRINLGDRVFPQVLLGKDGWMEYTGGGNLDDFQNVKMFENKEVIRKVLKALDQYLKSQDITLLIVVVPNKATIYPDKLAEQLKFLPKKSRLDRLISYLEINDLPVVVDIRPALQIARQDKDVYYKTDTHWNGYGAFVAYRTIIDTLGVSYPELKPYKISDLESVTTYPDVLGIPGVLMHASFITEPSFFFVPQEPFVQTLHPCDCLGYNQVSSIIDSKLPTLLMFHDSFGTKYLNNYLSMNFSKSHFVFLNSASQYLTKTAIQQFKPDIIIIEIVERNLETLPDYFLNFTSE